MPKREVLDKLSIYIPVTKARQRLVERLIAVGKKQDRSVNYLVVEAIVQYVDREESRK